MRGLRFFDRRPAFSSLVTLLSASALGASALAMGASGCTNETDAEPTLRVVSGSAQPVDAVAHTDVTAPSGVTVVSTLDASVALGTDSGFFLLDPSTGDTNELTVLGDDGSVTPAGAVSMVRRRGDGGLFVVTDAGLFHDYQNVLLRSPFNDALTSPIVTLDVFGVEGQPDELWITTADKALHASPDLTEFSVAEIGTIEAAFGIGHDRALAFSKGTAFEVDLDQGTVSVIEHGLGSIHGGSRAEDGSVYVAHRLWAARTQWRGCLPALHLGRRGRTGEARSRGCRLRSAR